MCVLKNMNYLFMFLLYNGFGPLSTILLAFWTNLWLLFFRNTSELPFGVVFNQGSLHHGNQITMIIRAHEPNRTTAPALFHNEVVVVTPVVLVGGIECYEWSAIEFKSAHS